ncbi:MAG: hypothetical protein MJ097_04670 [Dorea sp.]|nr:hypothetical protein [Dorea sp.]
MQKKLFLVCDSDEKFSNAFASYLAKKKELSFVVRACSSPEQIKEQSGDEKIGILLLGHNFPKGKRKLLHADWVFILTEDGKTESDENGIPVYKYQSAEVILSEIIRHVGEHAGKQALFSSGRRSKPFRMIGMFSPVHRTGQTTYAMKLGQELAVSESVLYLSLELYGGKNLSQEGSTIEDLLYYSRQENQNLGILLTTMVSQKGQMDYILPARVSENIRQVQTEEWQELFARISKESVYDVLIVDIDPGLREPYEILRLCKEIHVLSSEDDRSKSKISQFEEELRILGLEDIQKKVRKKVMS